MPQDTSKPTPAQLKVFGISLEIEQSNPPADEYPCFNVKFWTEKDGTATDSFSGDVRALKKIAGFLQSVAMKAENEFLSAS